MCGPNAGVLAVGETTYVVRLCRENGARINSPWFGDSANVSKAVFDLALGMAV
jgi:hypothetical protein